MAKAPEEHEHLSLMLSEVLSDIGVNSETITRRRHAALFREGVFVIDNIVNDRDNQTYCLGSQSEGSTTKGINSDTDILMCDNTPHVIHDWANWKHDVNNLLMVQDESTAPGYCLLQQLRDDAPLATDHVPNGYFYKDAKGRVLFKNSLFGDRLRNAGAEQHGPAGNLPAQGNVREQDYVPAFHCSQWPVEGRHWLNRRSRSGWPSAQLKSECENTGCFLVPVGSKIMGLDELEWRISTGKAERYLMFSLNIPQISCYVLMKMVLKTYQVFHNVISSYMCKTALFHCIENSELVLWQYHNLVHCLNQVLHILYNFIHRIDCPHFIIPGNNLMAGRISAEQRHNLLTTIQHIIDGNGRALFDVPIDNLGERLHMKVNRILIYPQHILSPEDIKLRIAGSICFNSVFDVIRSYTFYRKTHDSDNVIESLHKYISCYERCKENYYSLNQLEQKVYTNIIPLLCSTIGSLLASYCISTNTPLSNTVVSWLKRGRNSDVSSGLLKLATVCYSMGYIHITEDILRRVDQQYDRDVVMPVCGCYEEVQPMPKLGFMQAADRIEATEARRICAYCVIFLRGEANIVPHELRQEYNRSSPEDIQHRGRFDSWMDMAVIDSLPYLHFLQYKTFGRLGKRREQQRALHDLQQVIRNEPILQHKETSLNVLGQCFQQENLPNEAFHCYERSLQVRERNNAANVHIAQLLNR